MVDHPNRNLARYQAGEIIEKASIWVVISANAMSSTSRFPFHTIVIFMLYPYPIY